jgi:hypothetical protein
VKHPALLASAALFLALAGCAPSSPPVAVSPQDPSSPTAPEGPPPFVSKPSSLRSDVPVTHAQDAKDAHQEHAVHHEHAAPTSDGGVAARFVCPMDPEVTADEPGRCPKCTMKLVPKK